MKIYLIGMPASGKSTIGKALAKKLNYAFIDIDNYIEENESLDIPSIFEKFGEPYFRNLERESLKDFIGLDDVVISCGGGIVLNKENKALMEGPIIYLNASIMDLKVRLHKDNLNERPVSKQKSVEQIYEERKELYDYFKDFEVKSLIISNTVKDIMKELKCRYGIKKSISH